MNKRSLIKHSGIVFFITILGSGTGLLREITFAHYLGTSAEFDALTAVLNIILFVNSNISALIPFIVIPYLSHSLVHGDQSSLKNQLSHIIVFYGVISLGLVIIGEIFAPVIINFITPGFSRNIHELAVLLLRFGLFISVLAIAIGIVRSTLNAFKVFAAPALESIFFNAGIIGFLLISIKILEVNHVLSVILGIISTYILFFFFLKKILTKKADLNFDIWNGFNIGGVSTLARSAFWLILARSLHTLGPIILLAFASTLGEGSVSAFGYVQRLIVFLIGTSLNSFLIVFFPFLSEQANRGDIKTLKRRMTKYVPTVLMISILMAIIIMFSREWIVRLIYVHGSFGEESTKPVSDLLFYYTPWMIFFPLSAFLDRVFFAVKDYKSILMASAIGLVSLFFTAQFLIPLMGLNGLGLASSTQQLIYSMVLLIALMVKR